MRKLLTLAAALFVLAAAPASAQTRTTRQPQPENRTGRPVPTQDAARRPGDPPVLIASADRARRVLGWTRQFEALSEMIETAWEWRLRFPEGYPS